MNNDKSLLQVGDRLITASFSGLGCNSFKITRVTKTLAKSKRERDGYEYTFKRLISGNMSHPYQGFNSIRYTVERKENNNG